MPNKQYDWKKLFKEFMDGKWQTVKEFVEFCESQGNGYPTASSIYKKSAEDKWIDAKQEKYRNTLHKYLTDTKDNALRRDFEKELQFQRRLTLRQIELVEAITKRVASGENMEGIRININYSDVINDAKRSIGEKTKEQEQSGGVVNIQNNVGIEGHGSLRQRIEDMSEEELEKFETVEAEAELIEGGDIAMIEFTDGEEDIIIEEGE